MSDEELPFRPHSTTPHRSDMDISHGLIMRRYNLCDLFTLVARLLAPFVDPLRAEFATGTDVISVPFDTSVKIGTDCENSCRQQAAGIAVESTSVQSTGIPAVSTERHTGTLRTNVQPLLEQESGVAAVFDTSAGIPAGLASDAGIPASVPLTRVSATALYVRRGMGKGTRYDVAHPDTPGDKFRKRVTNGRAKYEPCL